MQQHYKYTRIYFKLANNFTTNIIDMSALKQSLPHVDYFLSDFYFFGQYCPIYPNLKLFIRNHQWCISKKK